MKDRILRLCRRLDKFTLDEISTITEDINESVLELDIKYLSDTNNLCSYKYR